MKRFILFVCLVVCLVNCNSNKTKNSYYENGNLKGIYSVDKHGNYKGEFKEFYRNGKVKRVGFYRNGKYDGELIEFYPNGDTLRIVHYSDGLAHGVFREFYLNGKVKMYAFSYQDSTVYYKKHDSIGDYSYHYFPAIIELNDPFITSGSNVNFNCTIPNFDKYFTEPLELYIKVLDTEKKQVLTSYKTIESSFTRISLRWSKRGFYSVHYSFIIPERNDTVNYSIPYSFKCE